jgi:hypothetical protein
MASIISTKTSGGGGIAVTGDTSGVLELQSNNGTTAVTIDASQNVGIGTASPIQKLDINGNVNATNHISVVGGTTYRGVAGGVESQIKNPITSGSTADLAFYTHTGSTQPERMRITSAGLLQFNSGYGSVATAYGCRAWVNFNGTGTVAIRASGNVSSITDNGTGDYTVNYTTAMPDANYSTCASNIGTTGTVTDTYQFVHSANVAPSTSSIRIKLRRDDGNVFDNNYISVAVFR